MVLFWALCVSYILLFIFARNIETAFTFPGKDINLKQLSNHPAGLIAAETVDITAPSGNNIHGIYIDNGASKTVYYFHGNGAPMDHFYTEMRYIADLGYNLISYDFPGYGKSTGKPTQQEILDFSNSFYDAMQQKLRFKDADVIIWGYSVGTATAIDFAKDKDFDSLVLFAPLASRYDMSAKVFGFPLQKLFFLPNTYVSVESIQEIDEPTFIIHGNRDTVVPFEQGKRVYEASLAKNKYFLELDDMGHSLITERYGDVLRWYLHQFLETKTWNPKKQILTRTQATKLLKKFQEEKKIQNLDIVSDTSLYKYVDPNVSFQTKDYIPEDLRFLSGSYIIDSKWNARIRDEAANAFEQLSEKFYEDTGEKIVVVSSYRSYTYQAGIKARGCPDNLCAKAGHSEHQSGLALDLWSASTEHQWKKSPKLMTYYTWLEKNAHNYGFHNSYQRGREIDGYEVEPWHWRYLGTKLATYLKEQDMTFAQYYYARNK